MAANPVYKGFRYHVRLNLSIPLAWAEFLRVVALKHYDWECRESATAGVIRGLCNTACDSDYPASIPVDWQGLDLLAKIMEQAYCAIDSPEQGERAVLIIRWIQQSKDLINAREQALALWDAAQVPSNPT